MRRAGHDTNHYTDTWGVRRRCCEGGKGTNLGESWTSLIRDLASQMSPEGSKLAGQREQKERCRQQTLGVQGSEAGGRGWGGRGSETRQGGVGFLSQGRGKRGRIGDRKAT